MSSEKNSFGFINIKFRHINSRNLDACREFIKNKAKDLVRKVYENTSDKNNFSRDRLKLELISAYSIAVEEIESNSQLFHLSEQYEYLESENNIFSKRLGMARDHGSSTNQKLRFSVFIDMRKNKILRYNFTLWHEISHVILGSFTSGLARTQAIYAEELTNVFTFELMFHELVFHDQIFLDDEKYTSIEKIKMMTKVSQVETSLVSTAIACTQKLKHPSALFKLRLVDRNKLIMIKISSNNNHHYINRLNRSLVPYESELWEFYVRNCRIPFSVKEKMSVWLPKSRNHVSHLNIIIDAVNTRYYTLVLVQLIRQ